ncbi:MAG: FixH family protein [Bacteroidota bacterium]|nr:MAG: FixH family protein [Bacteroidota bacterium]
MRLNWGRAIVIFFVLFISLAIFFIVFALRQNNDLVTDDYYEQGANYTTQIKTNARSVIYSDSIQTARLEEFFLVFLSPTLVNQTDTLKLHFYYPNGKQHDFSVAIPNPDDTLKVATRRLTPGRCILKINWTMNQLEYYVEKPVFIE